MLTVPWGAAFRKMQDIILDLPSNKNWRSEQECVGGYGKNDGNTRNDYKHEFNDEKVNGKERKRENRKKEKKINKIGKILGKLIILIFSVR